MTENPRRFGFGVPKADGSFDVGWRDLPLTEEAWAEFQTAVQVTADLRPMVVDHIALELDFNELEDVEPSLVKAAKGMHHPFNSGEATIISMAKAQRALSNFLASASSFREHALQDLIERHGSGSEIVAGFRSVLSDEFDQNFGYRVMYGLRNFAQHHDAPINTIPLHSSRDGEGNWVPRVQLVIDSARLSKSAKFNAKVRAELRAMGAPVPLMPLAASYMGSLRRLTLWLFLRERKRLGELELYSIEILTQMGLPEGAVPVIWEGPAMHQEPGKSNNQKAHLFSFDELAIIKRLVGRLRLKNPGRIELVEPSETEVDD